MIRSWWGFSVVDLFATIGALLHPHTRLEPLPNGGQFCVVTEVQFPYHRTEKLMKCKPMKINRLDWGWLGGIHANPFCWIARD